MYKPRRAFLTQLSVIAGVAAFNKPFNAVASVTKSVNTLNASQSAAAIYHTSDLNGHISAVYKNIGGLRHVKTVLKNQDIGGLLLDAGNFMSTSKSMLQQREMISMMNATGYHAAALGENELNMGQERLISLIPLMQFSFLNCNMQFDNQLAELVKPYIVVHSGNFKIGMTAVCKQIAGVKFNDPNASAARVARLLKINEKCDLVICLSHLGEESNREFAKQSENIDMVISGNAPKFCLNTQVLGNKSKHEIVLTQTGRNGLLFGRTIFNFDTQKNKSGVKAKHFIPGLPDDRELYAKTFSTLKLVSGLAV